MGSLSDSSVRGGHLSASMAHHWRSMSYCSKAYQGAGGSPELPASQVLRAYKETQGRPGEAVWAPDWTEFAEV